MNELSQNKTPEQMIEAIFALDLEPIKFKLMGKKEGHGWSRAEADQYELDYKRFLALLVKFPDDVIAPDTNVDKFWHGHILDTMKYAEDCNNIFGYFLHHYPYFGMRGEEDAANLEKAFAKMQRLYAQEFGDAAEESEQSAAWCGAAAGKPEQSAAWCGAAVAKPEQSAAWCGAAAGKPEQSAAWCGAAAGQPEKSAAWCGAAAGKPEQSAAWCGAAVGKPEQSAAWCGAAVGKPEQSAAWCGAAVGKPEKSAAWCGAAAGKPEKSAAWCGAAVGKPEQSAAWCGAAGMAGKKTDVSVAGARATA
jgi:hypothetical protein